MPPVVLATRAQPLVHAPTVRRRRTPGYDPENFPANYEAED